MTAIDFGIRVSFIQKLGVAKKVIKPSASRARREARVGRVVSSCASLFEVEYPDLGVSSGCDDRPVI